ncbi:hypothetical protein AVDCRST_MAG94-6836 [uncultured Leptolyngbya sp.]|uniref:Uncharacterized protein n=1 Tax=uncultured Leptolyngbya sp. TaxID=332963 RepID=A0A6J4PL00_9CYAN|nr:hypothetical protein AVDCRST_MAG94-6836 [uncultured Leptolyngbya sp.]
MQRLHPHAFVAPLLRGATNPRQQRQPRLCLRPTGTRALVLLN